MKMPGQYVSFSMLLPNRPRGLRIVVRADARNPNEFPLRFSHCSNGGRYTRTTTLGDRETGIEPTLFMLAIKSSCWTERLGRSGTPEKSVFIDIAPLLP